MDALNGQTTRNQHFVWRHYLTGWASSRGQVFCRRSGKIFSTKPKNILRERDFYAVREFSDGEFRFVTQIANMAKSKVAVDHHTSLIEKYRRISNVLKLLRLSESNDNVFQETIEKLAAQVGEDLQTAAENAGRSALDKVRSGVVNFMEKDCQISDWFHFISMQHFRTKGIRDVCLDSIDGLGSELDIDMSNIWGLISYIMASNLGSSMYLDRKKFEIFWIDNNTKRAFITGDKPTVNLFSLGDKSTVSELAFYYPASPTRAIFVSEKKFELRQKLASLNVSIVDELNALISRNSQDFLISHAETSLAESLVQKQAHGESFSLLPDDHRSVATTR